jgi:hypothetical protein
LLHKNQTGGQDFMCKAVPSRRRPFPPFNGRDRAINRRLAPTPLHPPTGRRASLLRESPADAAGHILAGFAFRVSGFRLRAAD